MRIALCDFEQKYLNSLLSYLYGKCSQNDFATFTTVSDFEEALNSTRFDVTIMGDEYYEEFIDKTMDSGRTKYGKLIVLSATIDNLKSVDVNNVIYKYGPMDGLYRMMEHKKCNVSGANTFAVYSPTHHELTEMYGLSLCQMLSENQKVLLIDTMHCPIIRKLIRDGPRGSLADVVYKLENNKSEEIKDLIEGYGEIDVLPLALNPMDVASINREQWKMLIEYIESLNYETYVFLVEDVNSGFKEIMSSVDRCILINRRGDYYTDTQESMNRFINNMGTKTQSIELHMSANNLTKGCYQLEELLTGNLGRFVRTQYNMAGSL